MNVRTGLLIAIIAFTAGSAAQPKSSYLEQPYGPANPLVSPDGLWALFGDYPRSQLWLEDRRTHDRRKVFDVTVQTLSLAWSPDSTAFIANDRVVSDVEIAYIYDVKTLDRLDLRSRIVAADPGSVRFFVPGQIPAAPSPAANAKVPTTSHVHAIRWRDATHVEFQLYGHTGGVRVGKTVRPGDCFDLRYRVARDGAVRKLSQRVVAISDTNGCAGMEGE